MMAVGALTASGMLTITPIACAGLVYAAQLGINFRRYRKGMITKKQFKRSAKLGAARTGGRVLFASVGAAVGFVGFIANPVVGIAGVTLGGVVGGICGAKISTKVYVKVETIVEKRKQFG
jgi:dolichol kinase